MSDQERQNIAVLVGRLDGKLDGVVETVSDIKGKVEEVSDYTYQIKSSLDGRITATNARMDDEKNARAKLESELVNTRRDFIETFNRHCADDERAFAGIHAKLDVIASEKSETRKTWSERLWAVSKFVGLIVGAWAAARLGVPTPTL
jgi:hypothetical protein